MRRGLAWAAGVILAWTCAAASASETTAWWVTGADGNVRRVEVVGLGASGLKLAGGGETGWGAVVRLEGEPTDVGEGATSGGGGLVLVLRDGQRWPGAADEASAGEKLVWRHSVLGKLEVGLSEVRTVERRGSGMASVEVAEGTEDVVRLENGDELRGVVTEVSGSGLVVQTAAGDVRAGWAAVARLMLAEVERAPAGTGGGGGGGFVQVELRDGTVVRGAGVELSGRRMRVEMAGGAREWDAGLVSSVEAVGLGGAGWPLTLLTPAEVMHDPYLSVRRPPVVDGGIGGRGLVWEGRTVRRGLGLTARTRVTWEVPGEAMRLRMGVRMDVLAPRGSAVVRVVWVASGGAEQVLWERVAGASVAWAEVALPPSTERGGGRLVIEADFGPSGGVQPWVNVLDPVLLR